MRRGALLLAFVASALASPYPAKPEKAAKDAATTTARGAGTGVTEKIAPSGAPQPGCVLDFSSDFALEARFIRTPPAIKDVVDAESSSASQAAPSAKSKPSASSAAAKSTTMELPSAAAVPSVKPAAVATSTSISIPSPAATVAAAEGDSTVILRSTRTQTRTVTVRRTVVGQKPTAESTPEIKGARKAYLVAQIGDGQLQVPTKPVTLSVSSASPSGGGSKSSAPAGTIAVPTNIVSSGVISQIGDGQIQAPKAPAAATSAPTPAVVHAEPPSAANPPPAAAAASGQAPPAAPPAAPAPAASPMAGMSGHDGMNMHRRQAPPAQDVGYACRGQKRKAVNGEEQVNAEVVLQGGILKDNHLDPRSNRAANRTGYIASNGQFQFDLVPQAGAIYTAGFSLCNGQNLALGSSSTWFQCRSCNEAPDPKDKTKKIITGCWYHLYDRPILDDKGKPASHCYESTVQLVELKNC